MTLRAYLQAPRLIRVLTDQLLVHLALVASFVVRFLLVDLSDRQVDLQGLAEAYQEAYFRSAGVVALVALVAFWAAGFYNAGPLYVRRKYPTLVLASAVPYLALASVGFLAGKALTFPRGVILLGCAFTALFVVGARVASSSWARVLRREGRLHERRSLAAIKVNTVLVIGGAGYIGSALIPRLLDRGYRVRLLDLLMFGEEPLGKHAKHPNLQILRADFRQVDKIVEAMRGVDAVIHLGGIVGDPACSVDEELTVDVNLTATRVIAEVARGEGVQRFIFASTCSVYGAGDDILSEESTPNPLSLYAKTKLASEKVLWRMAGDNFAPIVLRFGTIYGESGRTRFDLVVNLLSAKAVIDGKITVFGGDQWRPFVHVDDAARAVFLSLEAPLDSVREQVLNVGSDQQNFTIMEAAKVIGRLVPTAEIVTMGSDTDLRNYRVNFTKIRELLGFEPKWSLEEGAKQTLDAIASGRVTDYREAKHSNLKSFTDEGASQLFKPEGDWSRELLQTQNESEDAASGAAALPNAQTVHAS